MSNNGLAGTLGSVKVELTRNDDVKLRKARNARAGSVIFPGSLVAYDAGQVYPANFQNTGSTSARLSGFTLGGLSYFGVATSNAPAIAGLSCASSPLNGDIVAVYSTAVGNTTDFYRFNHKHELLQRQVVSASGSVSGQRSAVAFNSAGNFVVVYYVNGNTIAFRRIDSNGTDSGTVGAVASVASNWVDVAYSPNGEFVVAYNDATGTLTRFARYNAAGTLQGAITTIEAVNSSFGAVDYSANGEFVVAYQTGTTVKFARYNATGVLQGAITTVETITATNFVDVKYLSTGDFVVLYQTNGAATPPRFARYNATGVLQGALTNASASNAASNAFISANENEFFIHFDVAQNTIGFARFNNAGVATAASVNTSLAASGLGSTFNAFTGCLSRSNEVFFLVNASLVGGNVTQPATSGSSIYPVTARPVIAGVVNESLTSGQLARVIKNASIGSKYQFRVNHRLIGGVDVASVSNTATLTGGN